MKPSCIQNTFGEFLAVNDMTQARIAETEKYAHVTFFFNGGVEEPNKGCLLYTSKQSMLRFGITQKNTELKLKVWKNQNQIFMKTKKRKKNTKR